MMAATPLPRTTASALEVALGLARQAGRDITHAVRVGLRANTKDDGEATSNADREVSRSLVSALHAMFPGDIIVSEEESAVTEAVGGSRRPRVWFVDPIDGTNTLLAGDPGYCVMLGLAVGGRPELGVVHSPTGNATFWATRGTGVWLQIGAGAPRRLRCSDVAALEAVRPARCLAEHPEIVEVLGRASRESELHSVGLRLVAIAMGLQDLFVRSPVGGPAAWDTCAGEAILEEAGGRVTDVDGAPLLYDARRPRHQRGMIASNGHLHDAATDRLSVLWAPTEEGQ